MLYSLHSEKALKPTDVMWLQCPECDKPRTLRIEAVYCMGIAGSSVATFQCPKCRYKEDVLVEG